MIPKTIHYCWFGGKELPSLAVKCINSWKKQMPDCQIKEWNENNFNVDSIPYTQQAYSAKKYAFVSDYARFSILQEHGGIYMDVDVELIKPLTPLMTDDIIKLGMERPGQVNPGLIMIAPPNNRLLAELIENYKNEKFVFSDNMKTIVHYTSEKLLERGLQEKDMFQKLGDVNVYPTDYFCPINMSTNELVITENTYSIHHFAASWISQWGKVKRIVKKITGHKFYNFLHITKSKMKK